MMNYSYPKDKRLRKPAEFKQVFNQTSFKVHSAHFMAFVALTDNSANNTHTHTNINVNSNTNEPAQARLGMAITKKKLSKAVDRNRVKRLIKEQFRHQHDLLPALDVVFILKQPITHLSNQQISTEVSTLLTKVSTKCKRGK